MRYSLKKVMGRAAAAVLLLCFTGAAAADVIVYDNGAPAGVVDSLGLSDTRVALFNSANYLHAGDFVLASGMTAITGVRWWGLDPFGPPSSFTLSLYADDAGSPGTRLFSHFAGAVTPAASPYTFAGFIPLLEYEAFFSPPDLAAQTRYWLAIQNDVPGDSSWGWAPSAMVGMAQYNVNGGRWIQRDSDVAFALIGAAVVPLPGTAVLLLLGLCGVAAQQLRRGWAPRL